MKYFKLLLILVSLSILSCKTDAKEPSATTQESNLNLLAKETTSKTESLGVFPISHATMVLTYGTDEIYVDPTGGVDAFKEFPAPDIVLITDIHGDHYDIETLKALDLTETTIIAPKAVVDKFPSDLNPGITVTLGNYDKVTRNGYKFEAVPMYNLREEALKYHTKGRGNGYVITFDDERIYISGDTEDIPEMRALKNIDRAFICMNLPWTMTVDKAAEAVLEFKPKIVYPYHYRGSEGISDVKKFKTLINKGDENIEVVQLTWYQ